MVVDFHLLRDPRFIKVAAISTAVIAVSVGVGLTVAGTRKAPASSLQVNGGSGIEAVPKNGAANNGAQEMSSYLTNSDVDHLDTIDEIVDASSGLSESETVNGYSLYGINRDSGIDSHSDSDGGEVIESELVKTRKCGSVDEVISGEESSSKSGKETNGRRRLGWYGSWGNPIVSSGINAESGTKSEKTVIVSSTSSAKTEKNAIASSTTKSGKTVISTSTSSAKTEKTVGGSGGESSWGAGWGATTEDEPSSWGGEVSWDVDCESTTEVVVTSKASSSKASKAKSAKAMPERSSAKSTPATVASAWERSPWGRSPGTPWGSSAPSTSSAPSSAPSTSSAPSSAPSTSSAPSSVPSTPIPLESLAPVRTFFPTLSPIDEISTTAPTPCTGRVWYFNEEKEKCINDGENDGEDEYENMRTCCETEVGMNIECPYEDVCFTSLPTKAPTKTPSVAPSNAPTNSPSKAPSKKPTKAPTKAPTLAPTTLKPVVPEVITEEPTTPLPITSEPTSMAPTSDAPTTPEIITESPTTPAPVTAEPTSAAPTSAAPTTPEIITDEPTTVAPVTLEPTSATPTSATPTTPEIITEMPTTAAPITAEPTSAAPTVPEIITMQPSPAPTPCEGRKWYALSTQRVFQCTNGYDIPAEAVDFTFFNTLSECCDEMFGEGQECAFSDVCVETDETSSPTPAPSFGSTPTVSKETTGPPTFPLDRTGGGQS